MSCPNKDPNPACRFNLAGNPLRLRLITNSNAANVARDWFDAQKQAKAVGISGGVPDIGLAGVRSGTRLKTANPTSAGLKAFDLFLALEARRWHDYTFRRAGRDSWVCNKVANHPPY